MRDHDEIKIHGISPEQSRREVDRIERSEFSGHRLCGAVEYDRIDFNQLQRINQIEDRGASSGDFRIRQSCADSKPIQGSQALGRDQRTGDAAIYLSPLWQPVRLSEGET